MEHQTAQATSLPLAALAATDANQAANIVAASKTKRDATLNTNLLSVLQAMDGDKTARAETAGRALHSAYTLAAKNGNVSQIAEVIQSTGKRVCERAMRTALQTVGLGIAPDGTASGKGLKVMVAKEAERSKLTLDDYIDQQVSDALTIFVSIACKDKAPKAKPQAAASEVASESASETAGADSNEQAGADTVTVSVADMVAKMVQLIGTGALSAEEIDAIDTAIVAAKYGNADALPAMLKPQADVTAPALH